MAWHGRLRDGRGDTPQMDGPILRYEAEIVSNGIGSIKRKWKKTTQAIPYFR